MIWWIATYILTSLGSFGVPLGLLGLPLLMIATSEPLRRRHQRQDHKLDEGCCADATHLSGLVGDRLTEVDGESVVLGPRREVDLEALGQAGAKEDLHALGVTIATLEGLH